MISSYETFILNIIRHNLIGKTLPTNMFGEAGREAENLVESLGIPINRGKGCDILLLSWEIKTRKFTATSAQTVTSMIPENIICTPYKYSPVYEKVRKQLRFTTDHNNVIIDIDLCDFDQPQIQDLIEEGYEHARKLISLNPKISYTPYKGFWGYFERTKPDRPELDFRFGDGDMEKLLAMANSTFSTFLDYDN